MLRNHLNRGDNIIQIGHGRRVIGHPLIFYRAVPVNDKDGALGQTFEAGQIFVLDPILRDDLFVVIAQESEIQSHLFSKRLVAKRAIGTYANYFSVQTPNFSSAVSEPSPFCRSQSFQVSGEIKKVKG